MNEESVDLSKLGTYRDIPYESPEELYILQWLFELYDLGFATSIERCSSFLLSEPFRSKYTKVTKLKRKTKIEEKMEIILQGHIYTPEFLVAWDREKYDRFVWINYEDEGGGKFDKPLIGLRVNNPHIFTYIECKPDFDQNNMTRLFKINQKWVWDKYKIFINLLKPKQLFENTFTPKAYLTTKVGKPRNITWEVKSLEEYLKILNFND